MSKRPVRWSNYKIFSKLLLSVEQTSFFPQIPLTSGSWLSFQFHPSWLKLRIRAFRWIIGLIQPIPNIWAPFTSHFRPHASTSIGTEGHNTTISSICKALGPIMLIIYRTLASIEFSMVYDGVTRTNVFDTKEKSLSRQIFALYMVGARKVIFWKILVTYSRWILHWTCA